MSFLFSIIFDKIGFNNTIVLSFKYKVSICDNFNMGLSKDSK